MKNFMDLAKQRCSVRAYADTQVEDVKLKAVLEAGRIAPSACNNQPWKFLVIQSEEGLEKLREAARTFNAPAAIIVLGDKTKVWKRSHDGKDSLDIDTAIAAAHMVLEAEDLGLSTCWICAFKPKVVVKNFNVPRQLVPVHIIILGYDQHAKKPADRHSEERLPLESLLVNETFGG